MPHTNKIGAIFTNASAQGFLNGTAGTIQNGSGSISGLTTLRISGRSDGTNLHTGMIQNIKVWSANIPSATEMTTRTT